MDRIKEEQRDNGGVVGTSARVDGSYPAEIAVGKEDPASRYQNSPAKRTEEASVGIEVAATECGERRDPPAGAMVSSATATGGTV